MSQPTTRREITPLHVPWLQHEQFPATKQACSSQDGLVSGSKNGLLKVVQELKRGRANVDKQLAQLDAQLLAITDYVDGKSSNMFPPHLVTVVEDTPNVTASTSVTDGRRHYGAGVAGKYSGIFKSESTPPTPGMVEEDLNSDENTPCTTTGLWKYVYAYSFFKVITPEDMEQVLLLEDPNTFSDDLESNKQGKDKVLGALDIQRLQEKLSLSKYAPQYLDDFFKERLVASLCYVDSASSVKEDEDIQPDDEDKHLNDSTDAQAIAEMNPLLRSVNVESWDPKGLTRILRDIGLVEGNDKEIAQVSLISPMDDEVSQEIRSLQHQLRTFVHDTNETKRKLRKIMDETKPWLSQKKEDDEATIKKYFTMWQTKKELTRKKKLREKKLQRRRASRLGGGGGSEKPIKDDIDVKQR